MTKRILGVLLALAMCLCMVPATAFAQDSVKDIASSADFYAAAAAGGSYRLASDITLEAPAVGHLLEIHHEFSLDGEGHTITGWSVTQRDGNGYGLAIDCCGKVTLQNIRFDNFGCGTASTDEQASIISGYSGCNITIRNCTFANFNRQAIMFAPASGGSMTLEGCTIDCASSNPAYTIQKGIHIAAGTRESTVRINNCTIRNAHSGSDYWTAAAVEIFGGMVYFDGCDIADSDIGVCVEREYYNNLLGLTDYDVDSNVFLQDTNVTGCPISLVLVNHSGTQTTATVAFNGGGIMEGDVVYDNPDTATAGEKAKCSIEYYGGTFLGKTEGSLMGHHLRITLEYDDRSASQILPEGSTVSDLIEPQKEGFVFSGWYTADGKKLSPDTQLTDFDNATLYGRFTVPDTTSAVRYHTVRTRISGQGTVGPVGARGILTVYTGTAMTFTFTPDDGWAIGDVTVNHKSLGAVSEYTMENIRGNVLIDVRFVRTGAEPAEEALPGDPAPAPMPFEDVAEGSYCAEAVVWAAEQGITQGTDGTHFDPDKPCTRGEIVTFLWRAAGSPQPLGSAGFEDVPADSYCAAAVAWAVEQGITQGTDGTHFSPDASCTRAQAVTFLARFLGGSGDRSAAFSDVREDAWYSGPVAWAVGNGITEGVGGGRFAPGDICTRGQIVTFLYRAAAL